MRLATIISLGASAVLGIGALVVARVWLPSPDKETKALAMAPVVVAARPIAFGTKLDAKNLTVVNLPADATPTGAYRSINDVIKLDGGAPVALVAMSPREAVLPTKLSGAGARASMAAMITPGMRAYTIKVSDVAGVGGHVLPGDRVDVLLARQIEGGGDQAVEADVVLQNVRVLGINLNADQASTDKATPKTTTLEVTVADAGRLSIASKIGALSLALRRTGAGELEPTRVMRLGDLYPYGSPSFSRAAAPPAPPRQAAAPRPASRPGGLVIVNGDRRTTTGGAGA
jgi:pilus assembly protein CpaB